MAAPKRRTSTTKGAKSSTMPAGPKSRAQVKPSTLRHQLPTPDNSQSPDLGDSEAEGIGKARKPQDAAKSSTVSRLPARTGNKVTLSEKAKGKRRYVLADASDVFTASVHKAPSEESTAVKPRITRIPALQNRKLEAIVASTSRGVVTSTPRTAVAPSSSAIRIRTTSVVPERIHSAVRPVPLKNVVHTSPPRSKIVYSNSEDSDSDGEFLLKSHDFSKSHGGRRRTVAGEFEWDERSRSCVLKRERSRSRSLAFTAKIQDRSQAWPDATMLSSVPSPGPLEDDNVLDGLHELRFGEEGKPQHPFSNRGDTSPRHSERQLIRVLVPPADDSSRLEPVDEALAAMTFDFTNHDVADGTSSTGNMSDEDCAYSNSVQGVAPQKVVSKPTQEPIMAQDSISKASALLAPADEPVLGTNASPKQILNVQSPISRASTPQLRSPRLPQLASPSRHDSPRKRVRSDEGPSLQSLAYEAILGRLRSRQQAASPKHDEAQWISAHGNLLQEPALPKEERISPILPAEEQLPDVVSEHEPVQTSDRPVSPLPPSSPPPVASEVRSILEETDSDDSDVDDSRPLKRSATTPSDSKGGVDEQDRKKAVKKQPDAASEIIGPAPVLVITHDSPIMIRMLTSPRISPLKAAENGPRLRSLTPQLLPSPLACKLQSPLPSKLSPPSGRDRLRSNGDGTASPAIADFRLSPALDLSERLQRRSPSLPLKTVPALMNLSEDGNMLSSLGYDRSPMSVIRSANQANSRSQSPLKPASSDVGSIRKPSRTLTPVSPVFERSPARLSAATPNSPHHAVFTPLLARIQAYKRSVASRSPGLPFSVKEETPAPEDLSHIDIFGEVPIRVEEPEVIIDLTASVLCVPHGPAPQNASTASASRQLNGEDHRQRCGSDSSSSSPSIGSDAVTPYKTSAAKSLSFADIGGMDSSPLSAAASVGRNSFRALYGSSDESDDEEQVSPSRRRSQVSVKHGFRTKLSMSPIAYTARTPKAYHRQVLQTAAIGVSGDHFVPVIEPVSEHLVALGQEVISSGHLLEAAAMSSTSTSATASVSVDDASRVNSPRPSNTQATGLGSLTAAVLDSNQDHHSHRNPNEPAAVVVGDDSFVGPERPTLLTETEVSTSDELASQHYVTETPTDVVLSNALDQARPRSDLVVPPLPVRARSKQRVSSGTSSTRTAELIFQPIISVSVGQANHEISRESRSPSVVSIVNSNVSSRSAPIQISSADAHAAARAAAILTVHGQYINGSPIRSQALLPFSGNMNDGERLLDELLREAELEISMQAVRDSSEQLQDVQESSDRINRDEEKFTTEYTGESLANKSVRRFTSVPLHEQLAMWTRHNWRTLEQCFVDERRRCSKLYIGVNVTEVVRQFLESENIDQSECREEWSVAKIEARVEALIHRKEQRHAAQEYQRRRERSMSFVSSLHSRAPSEFFELADASTLANAGNAEDTVRIPTSCMLSPSSAIRPPMLTRAHPRPHRRAESVFSAASEPVLYSRQLSETTMSKVKKMYPSLDELELEVRRPRRNMSIRGRSIKAAVQLFERIEEEQSKDVLRAHLGKRKHSEPAEGIGHMVKRPKM